MLVPHNEIRKNPNPDIRRQGLRKPHKRRLSVQFLVFKGMLVDGKHKPIPLVGNYI